MLFVATFTYKTGLPAEKMREALPRRAAYQPPPTLTILGEWVLLGEGPGQPHIVAVGETENVAAISQMVGAWNDLFDINVTPAMTPQQLLQLGQEAAG